MLLAEPGVVLKDRYIRILLISALIVQIIICQTSIGFYHPDQHFQIIEFSSFQLGRPSAATRVWELSERIRPTLQVYLFSGYYRCCVALGLRDPYTQLTVLRMIFGLALFVFFNVLTIHYLRRENDRRALYGGLLLLNFSWLLPYTRTLYSSEMLSSLLYFGGIFYYDFMRGGEEGGRRRLAPVVTGVLLGMAFYCRFQTAFAIMGFFVWMFLRERKPLRLLSLGSGLLLAVGINILLDRGFYHQWVFTPYEYFRVNLIEGKAASMGTSSFLLYMGVLAAVVLTPPLSVVLLYSGFRVSVMAKRLHPVFLSVVFFIVGHCLIAHKEERFLFPVLNVLPIIVGWGIPSLVGWYRSFGRAGKMLARGVGWFSVGLNGVLLIVSLLVPYSQALYFTWQLKKAFKEQPVTIYAVEHTPFETDAGLPFVFYRSGAANIEWKKMAGDDSIRYAGARAAYVAGTYNHIAESTSQLEGLGYKKCFCSSPILWRINEWLKAGHINTINDVWVLYRRK